MPLVNDPASPYFGQLVSATSPWLTSQYPGSPNGAPVPHHPEIYVPGVPLGTLIPTRELTKLDEIPTMPFTSANFLDPRTLGLGLPSGFVSRNNVVTAFVDPMSGAGGGTTNSVTVADIADAVGASGGCDAIPNAALRAACKFAIQVAGGAAGTAMGNVATSSSAGAARAEAGASYAPCRQGEIQTPYGCQVPGISGMMQRALPGGATGYTWSPVLGIWGAGVTPAVVPSVSRRCPKGHVLGNDGVCYRRGQVSKQNRAWNPGTKPILTGGDVAALTKAKRLQKTIRRLATTHGPRKPCKCGIRKGKAVKV